MLAETVTRAKLCRVQYGSYTGTGTGGNAHPNTLSCGFCPALLIISNTDRYNNITRVFAVRSVSQFESGTGNRLNTITWNDRSVSWYPTMESDSYYNACDVQLNTSGVTLSVSAARL